MNRLLKGINFISVSGFLFFLGALVMAMVPGIFVEIATFHFIIFMVSTLFLLSTLSTILLFKLDEFVPINNANTNNEPNKVEQLKPHQKFAFRETDPKGHNQRTKTLFFSEDTVQNANICGDFNQIPGKGR